MLGVIASEEFPVLQNRNTVFTNIDRPSPAWQTSNPGNMLANFCTWLTSTKIPHKKTTMGEIHIIVAMVLLWF